MKPRLLALLAVVASVSTLAMPTVAQGEVGVGPGGGTPGTSSNFTLVAE